MVIVVVAMSALLLCIVCCTAYFDSSNVRREPADSDRRRVSRCFPPKHPRDSIRRVVPARPTRRVRTSVISAIAGWRRARRSECVRCDRWSAAVNLPASEFGIRRTCFVFHPRDVRHILHENHKNYWKGVVLGKLKRIGGEGLVFSDGDLWRQQRRLIQPAFHRDRRKFDAERMIALFQRAAGIPR